MSHFRLADTVLDPDDDEWQVTVLDRVNLQVTLASTDPQLQRHTIINVEQLGQGQLVVPPGWTVTKREPA